MSLEYDFGWTSTGSSGALTAVEVRWAAVESAFYVQHSTLTSTQSISLQSAIDSTGPWVTETSTSISTAVSTAFVLRVTGPINRWVRPYIHSASTGEYKFRLVGIE